MAFIIIGIYIYNYVKNLVHTREIGIDSNMIKYVERGNGPQVDRMEVGYACAYYCMYATAGGDGWNKGI